MLEYFRIGIVLKPHGIRGELKLQPLTDSPERFEGLKNAFWEREGKYEPCQLLSVRFNEGMAYIRIQHIDNREAAEALRNSYLCVARQDAVPLPEYTYFIEDLIGCEAFDTLGEKLGVITDVLQTGAVDVYEIRGIRKIFVPALKKVLHLVDLDSKRIVFESAVLKEVALIED